MAGLTGVTTKPPATRRAAFPLDLHRVEHDLLPREEQPSCNSDTKKDVGVVQKYGHVSVLAWIELQHIDGNQPPGVLDFEKQPGVNKSSNLFEQVAILRLAS